MQSTKAASAVADNIDLIGFWVCVLTMIAFFGSQVATYTDLLSQIF